MAPIAVESGSQETLNKVNKGLNLKMAQSTITMANQAGLRAPLFFIIGFPCETPDTMRKTIDVAKRLSVDQAHFFIATPFPGTKFYEIVKNTGIFLTDLEIVSTNYEYGPPVYETDSLKAEQVERIYKRAQREFHFRSKYILWALTTSIVNFRIIPGLLRERLSVLFPRSNNANMSRKL